MKRYKVIAACCFLTSLNIMLNHGDLTPEELHEDDAAPLVKDGFLEEADEWDVEPAAKTEGSEDKTTDKTTTPNTGRNKR